jgi:hypothetical protein
MKYETAKCLSDELWIKAWNVCFSTIKQRGAAFGRNQTLSR